MSDEKKVEALRAMGGRPIGLDRKYFPKGSSAWLFPFGGSLYKDEKKKGERA